MDKKKVVILVMLAIFIVALCVTAPFKTSIVKAEENYKTAFVSKNLGEYDIREIVFPFGGKKFLFFVDEISGKPYFFTTEEKRTKYVVNTEGSKIRDFPNISYNNVKKVYSYGTEVQLFGKIKEWEILKIKGKYYFCLDEDLSYTKPVEENTAELLFSASQFKTMGVAYWGGWRWTWYSQKVLPGGGLNIPGRHVDENGYVCDENNYICLASGTLAKGTIVSTPFGKMGKVYDSGCPANTLDVYVNF